MDKRDPNQVQPPSAADCQDAQNVGEQETDKVSKIRAAGAKEESVHACRPCTG